MKLYLKVNRPEGKRFVFLDMVTRQFNYKKVVFLYPEKATEVPTEFAEQLLDRDPHLVSKDPYDENYDPKLIRAAEIRKEQESNRIKYNPETTEQRKVANARFQRKKNVAVQPQVDPGLDQKAEEEAIVENVIKDHGEDPMQYVEILAQVSEFDREKMTIDTIRHFGKLINCRFTGKKREPLLKQLNKRCEELTAKIEEYMKNGPEGYMKDATTVSDQAEAPGGESGLPETEKEPMIEEPVEGFTAEEPVQEEETAESEK